MITEEFFDRAIRQHDPATIFDAAAECVVDQRPHEYPGARGLVPVMNSGAAPRFSVITTLPQATSWHAYRHGFRRSMEWLELSQPPKATVAHLHMPRARSSAKSSPSLERENHEFKRIVADKELAIDALKEITKGNCEPVASTSSGPDAPGPSRSLGAAGV